MSSPDGRPARLVHFTAAVYIKRDDALLHLLTGHYLGLPWIPSVDITKIEREPYAFPEEIQDITKQRAAILYYSRVTDRGRPYERARATACRLLR